MSTNTFPSGNHQISLANAIAMTYRYRHNLATILRTEYPLVLPLSETFNKDAFDPFFTNENCKGLRIYYGMDEDLGVHAIIVGVNDQNEDILPSESLTENNDDIILEDSQRCPPSCPPPSELNED